MNTVAKPSRHNPAHASSLAPRIEAIDWFNVEEELNGYGCAMLPKLLTGDECDALTALYPHEELYRSRVVMARHGFGRGEYKYFAYPLPPLIAELRHRLYPHLVPVANRWNEVMRIDVRYPAAHPEFIRRVTQVKALRMGTDARYCFQSWPNKQPKTVTRVLFA